MKRIINGKTYNTDTAVVVASGDNGRSLKDFWRRTEELYRTKKGAYFIYGSSDKITVVNNDGTLNFDPGRYELSTLLDWLKAWNVSGLDQREIDFFGITDA